MRQMISLSIIVPVYNEADFLHILLEEQIRQLKTIKLPFELLLCENGSQDKTLSIACKLALKYPQVRVLSLKHPNYGAAVRRGFLAAHNQYLVLFDLDYFDVNFVRQALPLLKNYSAIVGVKRGENAVDQRSLLRRLATTGFSVLLRVLFNLKISDTHGLKILNRKEFLPLINKCKLSRDIFDTELLIRGENQNLRITQIGVIVKERRASRSSIIWRSLRTLGDLAKLKILFIWEQLNKQL